MISAIGNSHSHYFSGSTNIVASECDKSHPYFRSYSIGPAISYNFVLNHLPTVKDLIQNKIKPSTKDYISLVGFSEIDCRWHLPKRITENGGKLEDIVNECVERFFKGIKELKDMGYNMVQVSTHTSSTYPHNEDPSNPVYGDCLFRNQITKQYNKRLEELCIEENIPYIDIFNYLIFPDTGLTNQYYYRDYCHLNDKSHSYMIEQFKNKGIIK